MKKTKRKLSFIDRFFLLLNFLLSIALLISTASPFVNPQKLWVVAFFGLAYPFLLITNVVLIFYWILRRRGWFLFPLVCILVGYNVLLASIGFRAPRTTLLADSTTVLKTMTYNVHNFKRYGAKNDISTKHEILQLISDQKPDVIGFQEFYTKSHGQYDMVDSIKQIMQSDQYYFEPFIFNGNEGIGMAIFSKYPITGRGMIKLSDDHGSENQCIYVDIKKENGSIRFYSVHLQSIRFDPEDYKYLGKVSKQGEANMGATKRLGSKLKVAFIKRSEQVVKVKESAAQCTTPYIISGDFNDTPASFAVNQMASGLTNTFREKGSGFGRTYNGDFPNYQIDYIMSSRQFKVGSYQIIEKKLSDHYPVCSTLLIR